MNIDKELKEILNDPLLDVSDKELSLFNIPSDMRKATTNRNQPDHYAQRKVCEDFETFRDGFTKIHQDLKTGRRSLIKTSKTDNMVQGNYYIVEGQMVLLQNIGEYVQATNGTKDGRTRCIFENGTETDILLQTLRKNVMADGYAITEMQENMLDNFVKPMDITDKDHVSGYVYILSSLSTNPDISSQKNLYKIGFTENSVEERLANAASDPTYLLAPVKVEANYKIVNMNSHLFESMVHQVLNAVQMQITIKDKSGTIYHPSEWYLVPLPVIDTIIQKIVDGSIAQYTYNSQLECLEKRIIKPKSTFDVSDMKVLTLNIKKIYFDEIMRGEKTIEYRVVKQTTQKKYIYFDEADGKPYLRRYDALRLYVGYHKDRESALVQVVDTKYNEGIVEYYLGQILEHITP